MQSALAAIGRKQPAETVRFGSKAGTLRSIGYAYAGCINCR